jgi:hypothetical protein
VEDILSDAVCNSIRRAERGVYEKASKQFRPEVPVMDLCMIVKGDGPGDSALTIIQKSKSGNLAECSASLSGKM